MAQAVTLTGPLVKVYFEANLLKECQSINWTIDYEETPIYGIDSVFPVEIAPGKISLQGSVTMVYVQAGGGLQGKDIRSRIQEVLYAPYISIRVKDRKNDLDLLFCPQVKVSQESMSISIKGHVQVTFSFKGIIPYNAMDLS